MRIRRQLTVGGVVLALLLCMSTFAGRAAAQVAGSVMDQIPGDAMVVLKVKNLGQTNKKLAKMAKDLGLDQMSPEWADPLAAFKQQAKLDKGLNEAGDMAIVYVDPKAAGGNPEKSIVVLVPVTDFKAFVGNFKDSAAEGAVTHAKSPDGGEDVYLAQWGTYAAVSPTKELLGKKPTGMKLQGAAAKEADTKDALLVANMPHLKGLALPQLKTNREQIMQGVEGGLAQAGAGGQKFAPVIKAVVGQALNLAEEFLNDARSATVGINLSDAGLAMTVVADFQPDSHLGKIAAQNKNTDAPLVVGLPDRKYFVVAGGVQDPGSAAKLMKDMLDPIKAELSKLPEAKAISDAVEGWEKASTSLTAYSMGYVAPTGQPRQESLVQAVTVLQGDAPAIQAAQRQMFGAMSELVKMMPNQEKAKTTFTYKQDARTVAGVKLDEFKSSTDFPADSPEGQQAKKILDVMYGAGGAGQTGVLGQVGPKTLVSVQGGPDALVTEAIAAAKGGAAMKEPANVKAVAAQLPKTRAFVAYVELDTILNTGIRYAKEFFPVAIKSLPDLPPIGLSGGSDQSAIRFDVAIPMDLVKGIMSAGMEFQKQMQNPNGGL